MKNVVGGLLPFACSISADCYKQVYNSSTHSWESKKVASVSCSGSGDCTSSSYQVSCPQSSGDPDTASCPSGSYIA